MTQTEPETLQAELVPTAPSEWAVFFGLRHFPAGATAEELISAVKEDLPERELSPTFVGLLLERLIEKGYVCCEPREAAGADGQHVFHPRLSLRVALKRQLKRFLEEYAGDDGGTMRIVHELLAERLAERGAS